MKHKLGLWWLGAMVVGGGASGYGCGNGCCGCGY